MKRLEEKEPAETEKWLPQREEKGEGGEERRERTMGRRKKKVKFRKKSGKS